MSDRSEGTLVLELADVVSDLTHRQSELLGCLREFRAELLGAESTVEAHQTSPPRYLQPPPPAEGQCCIDPRGRVPIPASIPRAVPVAAPMCPRSSRPGPAPSAPAPPVPAPAPPPAAPAPPAVSVLWDQPQRIASERPHRRHRWRAVALDFGDATKRDYDYFVELDDLLARLPVDPEVSGTGPTDRPVAAHAGASYGIPVTFTIQRQPDGATHLKLLDPGARLGRHRLTRRAALADGRGAPRFAPEWDHEDLE